MIRLNLALQGGGAHGAFTWGVLDRLLQDDGLEIAGISGTSAGALNGAALKAGLATGGREGARANLRWVWEQVGAVTTPWAQDWLAAAAPSAGWLAAMTSVSPAFMAFDVMARTTSPYVYGSVFRNPLERILRDMRFEEICADSGPALYIGATNVRTGKIRVFSGQQITPEAIMASACLPTLFEAIEIEDPDTGRTEAYWDGGYTGNPPLFPLYRNDLPNDVVIVNINPLVRDEVPKSAEAITNRINEIGFNTSLLGELRSIHFVQRLLETGAIQSGTMKAVRIHLIEDDALMNELNVATKTIPNPVILARLKEAGEQAAERFLQDHRADLGTRSSVDLKAMFS
ncbi:patatin-like phospholipase family protein [Salipiger sp. IMCC34102]|uniref:patatin-like phospholipase family protein n=1 Tax=Salipiger sp. IMCC34102 TaxID=2510647 RepID=UPI00101E168C|nr:patatin-like phospholipase family protein [Salipiger sp. IMCC34102]RYH03125.1 patatin-like phospholipase family protein [Salipiger sp. IMCC34102]